MEYEIRFHPKVVKQVARWGLSDYLLVEVYQALREELAADPLGHIHRDADRPQHGGFFVFDRRDPYSPLFRHIFQFRVFFDEDEQHLHVVRASYWRSIDV